MVSVIISTFTSMGGVSGAFLLLPFQVSVLGFTGPGVSPTNMLFNVVAIPSGVWRYVRNRQMVWPLALTIALGTAPGIVAGAWLRVRFLPDPRHFKLFVGLVLIYVAWRLAASLRQPPPQRGDGRFEVTRAHVGLKHISYEFNGLPYRITVWKLVLLVTLVGVLGGAYGIGGGAIIAPFLVAAFKLPVHSIAGVALFGTLVSSVMGVGAYILMDVLDVPRGTGAQPDWALGVLFGLGGMLGMYIGASLQRKVPARAIKALLAVLIMYVSASYITAWFGPK